MSLPKGMDGPKPQEQKQPQVARSEEHNILGEILLALRDLPFAIEVDEAVLFESDSSQTSVKLNIRALNHPQE